jgi:hypothetical protein
MLQLDLFDFKVNRRLINTERESNSPKITILRTGKDPGLPFVLSKA